MKYSAISEFFKFEVKNSFRVICPYPLACPCVYKHKHLIFSIWGYTSSKRVSQQTPPWLAPYPIEEFTLSRFLPRIHSFRWTIYLGKKWIDLDFFYFEASFVKLLLCNTKTFSFLQGSFLRVFSWRNQCKVKSIFS